MWRNIFKKFLLTVANAEHIIYLSEKFGIEQLREL